MLRPGADVGEGQRDEKVGDRPLAIDHAKAFFDHPFQVNPPPANHTVNLWIGARFDDHRQFAHLLVGQEPGAARTGTVLQAVCPFIVEAVRPVSQRLAIHAAEAAGRTLDDIELHAACSVEIGDNVEGMIAARRNGVAFQMGGMGSATTNFYNDAFKRAGYADQATEIQRLWVAGKRDEARQIVPDEMITQFGAIGTPEMVRDRFLVYKAAGVDSLSLRFDNALKTNEKAAMLEQVMDILKDVA